MAVHSEWRYFLYHVLCIFPTRQSQNEVLSDEF
jgi:hypothetical protein